MFDLSGLLSFFSFFFSFTSLIADDVDLMCGERIQKMFLEILENPEMRGLRHVDRGSRSSSSIRSTRNFGSPNLNICANRCDLDKSEYLNGVFTSGKDRNCNKDRINFVCKEFLTFLNFKC